jgi:hypothetical protein
MAVRVFDGVWYLPDESRWSDGRVLAYRDVGRLVVGEDSLEFQGKKQRVAIAGILRISFGKQGRDFINNWVKVEYEAEQKPATAFFADGSLLGWGGLLGGTKAILEAVQHLAKG